MKKKDITFITVTVLIIAAGFTLIAGLIYIQRTNQIKKITFQSKENVDIVLINDLPEQYQFITATDTYYVIKEYAPSLDWKTIEKIDLSQKFNIVSTSTELVTVKNDNQKILDIDIIKAKQEDRDEFVTTAFYLCLGICILFPLMAVIILPLERWSITKIEKNILLIPNTVKINEKSFHYSYRGIHFILIHHYYSKANFIRVYIPIAAENLIVPNNMHTEKIDNEPYCYFDYNIFIHGVNVKKFQSKIDSKFRK